MWGGVGDISTFPPLMPLQMPSLPCSSPLAPPGSQTVHGSGALALVLPLLPPTSSALDSVHCVWGCCSSLLLIETALLPLLVLVVLLGLY